jgi:hypothetical protein
MDNKLTDNEIIKGLEDTLHRIKGAERLIVPKFGVENLCNGLGNALDLINRLQAENESKQATIDSFTDIGKLYSEIKAEAYKEFADRLKNEMKICLYGNYISQPLKRMVVEDIDNLLKELVGDK